MSVKRYAYKTSVIFSLVGVLILSSNQLAHAANSIGFSSLGTGCVYSYTNTYFQSNRYIAKKSVSLAAINFLVGSGSASNFSTSRIYVYSNNATSNTPDSAIATFMPDAITGSGSMTAGRFVGSYAISEGTKFWIVPSVNAGTLPWCYWPSVTTTSLTMNGIVPDTSTSLANNLFRKVYDGGASIPASSGWDFSGDAGQLWQLSIEIIPPEPLTATISLSGGAKTATKRVNNSLIATLNGPAKVTFYSGGKIIPGCRNISSVAGVATCNWKPSVISVNRITAKAISQDSAFTDNWATPVSISVVKRTTTR